MSEYQYYEFQSIDQALSTKDRKEISSWSSRSDCSNRKAVFNYSYGDFPKNINEVLLKYFDAALYLSNWGTRQLLFKLPIALVNLNSLLAYNTSIYLEQESCLNIEQKGEFVVIDINLNKEEWWIEGEGVLSDLVGLRNAILEGDYRSLFIVWLHILSLKYEQEEMVEITSINPNLIPPNLKETTSELDALIEFAAINKDWIVAAANYSKTTTKENIDFEAQLKLLDANKKNEYLLRILQGENNLALKLKKELATLGKEKINVTTFNTEIKLEKLIATVDNVTAQRKAAIAEAKKIAHQKKMEQLVIEKKYVLESIDRHLLKSHATAYDKAVDAMLDLKDLAKYQNKELEFNQYMAGIMEKYGRRGTLIRRLKDQDLV